jgi:hypothetical protein
MGKQDGRGFVQLARDYGTTSERKAFKHRRTDLFVSLFYQFI